MFGWLGGNAIVPTIAVMGRTKIEQCAVSNRSPLFHYICAALDSGICQPVTN